VQPAAGLVHIQDFAGQVLDQDCVRRIFKQIAEALLGLAQLALGPDALKRAAALVGEGLQHFKIALRVGAG